MEFELLLCGEKLTKFNYFNFLDITSDSLAIKGKIDFGAPPFLQENLNWSDVSTPCQIIESEKTLKIRPLEQLMLASC